MTTTFKPLPKGAGVRNTATQDTKAASNACGPVKGHVVYVDSQGVRHELDYVQVGDPCSHS
ncbi:DUF2790 domain-containing protein [Pseudomonas tolaasii]|uniref:DUF2790 domain-containing protein n=1 Tax=Pseudomonas tolaasii TaxID=29442 RepID=UPI002732A716|nr:DUF2790 domain-containing protein [Pseudomonas tolaasii]WLH54634.1 DUF2790 domain-containing protein [Pseudomonas tolaasii]